MSETMQEASAYAHTAGPVFASCWDFGQRHTGPYDAMIVFGGTTPEKMPEAMQGALTGHMARGDRVLLLTHDASQQSWVRAQVTLLASVAGRG